MNKTNNALQPETSDIPNTTVITNVRNVWLLVIFFIVRIPVTLLIGADNTKTHWEFVGLFLAYYVIVAALIWNNRNNLISYHMDKIAIYLFLLFGTFFRVREFDSYISLFLEMTIILFVAIFWFMLTISKIKLRPIKGINMWNGIAILLGVGVAVLKLLIDQKTNVLSFQNSTFIVYAVTFLLNLVSAVGTAGIIEEPIYRGFLWGTLRNLKWQENRILVFQGILFWISHLSYLNKPIAFWVVLPIVSLLLGFLVKKSRSIIPSIIFHAIYNAV